MQLNGQEEVEPDGSRIEEAQLQQLARHSSSRQLYPGSMNGVKAPHLAPSWRCEKGCQEPRVTDYLTQQGELEVQE